MPVPSFSPALLVCLAATFTPQSHEPAPGRGGADLLDVAWSAASRMPRDPHAKTRARLLESVAQATLAAGDAAGALERARAIEDWRRGVVLAELARHHAAAGDPARASTLVAQALAVADERTRLPNEPAWRVERIRALAAGVHDRLDRPAEALRLARSVGVAEWGPLAAVEAQRLDPAQLDAALQAAATAGAAGLDAARNAQQTCVALFERFAADGERRLRIERTLREDFGKVPPALRIDAAVRAGDIALRAGDAACAARFAAQGGAVLESAHWLPEDRIPLACRTAALRWRAGEHDAARAAIATEQARYVEHEAAIVDIARAGVLRALAEARLAIGDGAGARAAFAQAIESGTKNPNARPRAEDLVATCLALTRLGVEPDAATRARITRIAEELDAPW